MSVFDQRNQQVTYQYNAAGDINLNTVQNRAELLGELDKLKAEVARAAAARVIDAEVATDTEYHLTKATQQAQNTDPDKSTILSHLNTAKQLLSNVAAVGGLVTALAKVAELAQHLL